MTTETIVKLLKSPVEADKIIIGNYMVRNLTFLEIKEIFDKYGDDKHNSSCSNVDIYLSRNCFEDGSSHPTPFNYIRTAEYTLLLCYQSWLLKPNWLLDADISTLKNVEI